MNLKNGGSGIIFPYALCGSFGPTGVESSISGKYTYSTFLKNPSKKPIGICGYEISLERGSKLSLSTSESFRGTSSETIEIWIYSPIDSSHISCSGLTPISRTLVNKNTYVYRFNASKPIKSVEIKAIIPCSFWGVDFHSEQGLIYQQNGLVGAQFIHLIQQRDEVLGQLKWIKPEMIVFSYGTNESYSNFDSLNYYNKIKNFILDIQKELPQTVILISNAPDTRSANKIPQKEICINRILEQIATENKISFLDINKAMGGWGSLYLWQKSNLFLSDLLHFNQEGAKLIADFFTLSLMKCAQFDSLIIKPYESNVTSKMSAVLYGQSISLVPDPIKNNEPENRPINNNANKPVQKKVYIVKKGDTLSHIAKKTHKSVKELVKINHLKSPDQIRVGQKIYY
ncbi:MAG: hypothetical protein RL365_292 [Bacteroidota bacterium]